MRWWSWARGWHQSISLRWRMPRPGGCICVWARSRSRTRRPIPAEPPTMGRDWVQEARAIVRLAKYPPIGNRGISGQGPHTGYKSYGARHATEYAPSANENIIICPSIESLEGLENVEEIAAVEGIDMIAYGHSDLSAQLGVHLDLEHPTFKAAVRRIAAACNAHGKLARGSAETEAQIEEYWQLGCKVLNLPGNDVSTYLDGMKARAGRAHARLKSIGVPIP